MFPAVIGPGGEYFIIDHHHLGIALIEQGVKDGYVAVLDDLSWLELPVFWRTMEFRSWSHPYDRRGRRCDYREMPRRLKDLQDDPYRSLAGLVRRAGGYAKDEAPFVEFLWADYFRPRVSGEADPARAGPRAAGRPAAGAFGGSALPARMERQTRLTGSELSSGVTIRSSRSAVHTGCLSFQPSSTSTPCRSIVKLTGMCQMRP